MMTELDDEEAPPQAPRKAYLFADLDYFDPTDLANQLLDATGQSLSLSGASGSNSVSAAGAWGGRVGMLFTLDPKLALGGSFGYIAGPRLSESAQGTANGGGAFTFSAMGIGCSTPLTTGTAAGFSWEVEPSILYGRFGIAFRYAQFPGGLSSGGQFTREWASFGSFLEVAF